MPANEIGLAILGPLRELDEVAYLRFASVYRAFESAEDFETEIAMLRTGARRARPEHNLSRRADHRPPRCVVGKPRAGHQQRRKHRRHRKRMK